MELELFGELAVIGGLAVATAIGLHRIGLPSTVGFLVTGAIAGPHGLRLVGDPEHIEQIAELGVILLLFAVGLEFSRTRYLSDRDDLVALGADHVVCEEVEGGTEMTAGVLKSLGLATPAIYDQINTALGSDSGEYLAGAMDDWTEPADQKR